MELIEHYKGKDGNKYVSQCDPNGESFWWSPRSNPLYAKGANIHSSSELNNCIKWNNGILVNLFLIVILKMLGLFVYLDLELQKLDVMNSFFKHGTDINLGSIGNKFL